MSDILHNEQVVELLPAYALGALEPEEMEAVGNYLERQRKLLAELDALEDTAAQLALSAPDVPLPPEAKTRLMERVAADLGREHVTPVPPVTFPGPRNISLPMPWGRMAAVLLPLAAVFVLGLYIVRLHDTLQQARARVAYAEQTIAVLEQRNVALEEELGRSRNRLALISGAQRIVRVSGTEAAPNAQATFYEGAEEGLLLWDNLDTLAEDQEYQLWLIPPDGDPMSAGVMGRGDTGALTVPLAGLQGEYAAVGVSVEPRGGSPAPTGPIVLLGEVATGEAEF